MLFCHSLQENELCIDLLTLWKLVQIYNIFLHNLISYSNCNSNIQFPLNYCINWNQSWVFFLSFSSVIISCKTINCQTREMANVITAEIPKPSYEKEPSAWSHILVYFQISLFISVLLPGQSHGWRSLVGCSPRSRQQSDMTKQLHFHFSLSCIGEGNGNPFQCSCWRIPGTAEPGRLPSMGLHRVGHDWSDLAAAIHLKILKFLKPWMRGVTLLASLLKCSEMLFNLSGLKWNKESKTLDLIMRGFFFFFFKQLSWKSLSHNRGKTREKQTLHPGETKDSHDFKHELSCWIYKMFWFTPFLIGTLKRLILEHQERLVDSNNYMRHSFGNWHSCIQILIND